MAIVAFLASKVLHIPLFNFMANVCSPLQFNDIDILLLFVNYLKHTVYSSPDSSTISYVRVLFCSLLFLLGIAHDRLGLVGFFLSFFLSFFL